MPTEEPIAVVGIGCRFPGSSSTPSKFWNLLCNPKDVGSRIPRERFDADTFYHPDGSNHGTTNAQKAYFLTENVAAFDAPFFKISTKEAEAIDPQQRLVLETVYEGVEAAGLRLDDLKGSPTGVFCGVMCDDYQAIQQRDLSNIPHYTATGTGRSIIANRVSYFFDWNGPSMTIDTACSSSLVAVHLASNALHDGSCNVAIASGTNLILAPNMFISGSKLGMLSPRGRSRMWDAGADGYARGEGVAAVVLKRLSDAVADGDNIECIVRGTNVNQDGRSTGITMPSSAAQTRLIASTYKKAGLDPINRPEDRCQYFEAHGTGTKAGDPQEASAIHAAFFPESVKQDGESNNDVLYVGSVKTVIGHTEGTAGLAALIKAAKSIQHGVMVPNLHFDSLNPAIEPYYGNLRIPTECQTWPDLPAGAPRRVSVNSFGFGGTNAHVIVEAYAPSEIEDLGLQGSRRWESIGIIPFVFSAPSEKALGNVLATYVEYLGSQPSIDLVDLAWTLFRRRTAFSHRVAFYAPSVDSLKERMQEEIARRGTDKGSSTVTAKPLSGQRAKILGIFTGQGAQWPRMGLDLINSSATARKWLDGLQASLDQLPIEYRPVYSLFKELAAPQEQSRLHLADIAQPLCTAVQIILVKFLRSLGFSFSAVAGHSSGEIGAAYAVGVLSESEAIRIAHLRGHVTSLAGSDGKQGAMMAVGMSADEAQELCASSTLDGKIKIAAVNASSSVTLSGDADAIKSLETQLKDDGVFARLLKVNMAYHSHHMLPCSDTYLRGLETCQIKPKEPSQGKWFSSVYNGRKISAMDLDALRGRYWCENMVNTVLLTDAVTGAVNYSSYDMIMEVGPHPALKGPVLNTLSELSDQGSSNVAYTSLLNRSLSSKESSAKAIGDIYSYLGPDHVNIEEYVRCVDEGNQFHLLKDLPCYPFDRSNTLWAESRLSKAFFRDAGSPNQLLGTISPESTNSGYRWRNFISEKEVEWLGGHSIQAQVVFPATGYVAMALEAAYRIAGSRRLQLFDIQDLVIKSAISLNEEDNGVETLFEVNQLVESDGQLSAAFACFSTVAGNLQLCASGRLSVLLGDQTNTKVLPSRQPHLQGMSEVEIESFYNFLSGLGYGYSGLFKGISSLRWKQNMSDGCIRNASQLDPSSPLAMHPALMDLLLQGMLAAVGKPGNEKLYTLHIPVSIGRILINPAFCGSAVHELGAELPFEAVLTRVDREGAIGDASLFDGAGNGVIQMERINVTPLMQATAADDRQVFFGVQWGRLLPDLAPSPIYMNTSEGERCRDAEKLALVYMRDVQANLTTDDRAKLDWHGSRVVAWIDHVLSLTRDGRHPVCSRDWLSESCEEAELQLAKTCNPVEQALMRVVGQNMLRFLRQETTILEELRHSGLLDAIYKETEELSHFNQRVADVVGQIATRFPRMRILEIGAGSGSATKAVLHRLGRDMYSYTFTDISSGFFDQAEANFASHSDLLVYRILDIEKDPAEQGFQPCSFDLVIAANVLHATRDIQQTLTNTRTLLKPGGHLVLLEGANPDLLRISFTMCGFDGWWLGEKDERPFGAMTTPTRWHNVLQKTGFSGIDTITPGHDDGLTAISVFASQAVDDHINLLRNPLAIAPLPETASSPSDLVIVGGATLGTSKLVGALKGLLCPYFTSIFHVESLQSTVPPSLQGITLLNLGDLDRPLFETLNPQSMKALQELVDVSQNLLWVTAGADADKPYQSMSQALLRCLMYESSHTRFQHLNIEDTRAVEGRLIAESLLRLVLAQFDNDCRLPRVTETIEPELRLVDGVMSIPRITPDVGMNERYISQRRLIYRETDPERDNVVVTFRDGAYEPLSVPLPVTDNDTSTPMTVVRVAVSTLTALRVRDSGFLHLSVGHDINTNKPVVALSTENAAVVSTPSSCVVPVRPFGSDAHALLAAVAWTMLAIDLVGRAAPLSSLVVHEASKSLQAAVRFESSKRLVHPYFTTAKEGVAMGDDQVSLLHPLTPTRKLVQSIPANVSLVATFDEKNGQLFNRLPAVIQGKLTQESMETVQSTLSASRSGSDVDPAANILQHAVGLCTVDNMKSEDVTVIDLHSVPEHQAELSKLQLLDWQTASETGRVPVSIQPASSEVTLSSNKTYLMVGMTGDLGMSVCEWMVSKGARNVVLTSRKPQTDQSWIDAMSQLGARVVTMDVTSRESIQQVDRRIQETLPTVGGVVNGAMILQDQLFTSMSFENMERVLKPKVQGSLLLDEVYSTRDLEFFICFGSLTGPAGNTGQSAYAAATSFMTSLVEGRRKRGLAGSIMCPGEIRGVGYVARTDQGLVDLIRNAIGDTSISEGELNELFAEAILGGRPDSGREAAPIAGFPTVDPDEQPHIVWLRSPRTWRLLEYSGATSAQASAGEVVSAKQQLASVGSVQEARGIIQEALLAKVRKKLQLPEDAELTEDHSLMELGIDSLVAVDLRTWFVKELMVDMPVIKLLNSGSIAELIDRALTELPPDLLGSTPETEKPKAVVEDKAAAKPVEVPKPDEQKYRGEPPMERKDSQDSIESQTTSPPSDTSGPSGDDMPSPLTTDSGAATPGVEKGPLTPKFERVERLSYAQSRFWFLQQLRSDKTYSNITTLLELDGTPDVDRMRVAVSLVGSRHEVLRTCYRRGEDGPYQAILPTPTFRMEVLHVKSETDVQDIYHSHRQHVYDLENGDNIRMCLAITPDKRHFVVIGFHHICLDGVSFYMLLDELEAAYVNRPLPPVPKQYADYAAAQRAAYDSGKNARDVDYWRKEFETVPDPIPLFPMSRVRARQVLDDHPMEDVRIELPTRIMAAVKDVSRRLRVTPANFFMAVLRVFLSRLTQSEDFCIGIGDVHRVDEDDHSLIGLLLNLLPVRFTGGLDGQTFRQILLHTQTRVRGAIAHSRVQFDRLLDELSVPRSATHSPLFQVMLDWQPQNTEKRSFGDHKATIREWTINKTAFDMVLSFMDSGDGTAVLNFHLQQALFTNDAAYLVARSFVSLLESFTTNIDQKVTEPSLYPAKDLEQAQELGRGPSMTSQWPSTVSKQIDHVSRTFADSIAVNEAGSSRSLTYSALDEHTNIIAANLAENGVGSGSKVCLFQQPSANWISCMLAVWRLGATYVPLDMSSPAERTTLVLQDCKPQLILCDNEAEAITNRMPLADVPILNVSSLNTSQDPRTVAPENQSTPEACSVILYSSGTTGKPKGYQLSHANLQNQLEGFTSHCKLDGPTVLQQGAMTFDISLEQMLAALTTGGRVVVAPRAVRVDPTALAKAIVDEDITCTMATPSEYLMWIQYAPDVLTKAKVWERAFSGGEAFPGRLCDAFRDLNLADLRLFNFYGPGETTIASHHMEVNYKDSNSGSGPVIPVGHTLPNYATHIVDHQLNPVPQGIPGEIVIAGPGVCNGYLNLDELNATKFIPGPSHSGHRAYRTSEKGHLQPDGSLVLEGRLEGDTQVKLRGMRIDVCDVENEILRVADGALSRVVVSLRDTSGSFLAAHAEFQPDFQGDKEEFLRAVRAPLSLPQNMRPAIIVPIDQMPTTAHGKLDRRVIGSLPLPERKRSSVTLEPALQVNEWVQRIARLWQEALEGTWTDCSDLGLETDFFLAGGNSLLLVKLQTLLSEKAGVSIPLIQLVEGSTLRDMADAAASYVSRAGNVASVGSDAIPMVRLALYTVLKQLSRPPTSMTISSERPTALPDETLFQRMLEHANARPNDIAISDNSLGVQADYVKVFADVLHMRDLIQNHSHAQDAEKPSFISILIPINYQFIISALAVLAAGGAFAPIRFGSSAEFALGSILRSRATCMVYSTDEEDFAVEIQRLATAKGHNLEIVPFELPSTPAPSQLSDLGLYLDTQNPICADRPAMLTFSTGTTGLKPKGIVHSRRFFNRPWRLPPQAVFLIIPDPFHLISYLNTMTVPLLGGCQLRIIDYADGPAGIWEQFRSGRISSFSAIPNIWEDLAWYYRNKLQLLPDDVREGYLEGARRMIYPYTMGVVTPPSVLRFWEDVKRPLFNAFGATELGGLALSTTADTESKHYRCIGKPSASVEVKLSEGDQGELLINYLEDPERTRAVIDEDGFYHTGDRAFVLPNGEYIYEDRINKPKKDPLAQGKTALSRLSYIEDVTGAMIPFTNEYGTHIVGLVVRLKHESPSQSGTEKYIAKCLHRLSVSVYGLYMQLEGMFPIAVRVLGPDSEGAACDGVDVEEILPYSKDRTFRADIEYAVHRVWLN
ncbi:hypothetical protein BDW62DRAFT_203848 [Aspergillus aurantiobrunneus]